MGNYNIYKIPKGNGKFRIIADPSSECRQKSEVMLSQLNAAINMWHVYDILPVASRSYAYIPGRSCKTLVDKMYTDIGSCKDYDIFSIDVKDYFSSIRRDQVIQLTSLLPIISPHFLDKLWDELHPDHAREYFPYDNIGIAQGNPVCPVIANLVGFKYIDNIYSQWYNTSGGDLLKELGVLEPSYYRYSDNIFIVIKRTGNYSRDRIYKSIRSAYDRCIDFKFTMSVSGSHQLNVLLGIRLGDNRGRLKNKAWLRNLFYRIRTKNLAVLKHKDVIECFGNDLSWEDFTQKVAGLISYSVGIEPELRKYIGNLIEDMESHIES